MCAQCDAFTKLGIHGIQHDSPAQKAYIPLLKGGKLKDVQWLRELLDEKPDLKLASRPYSPEVFGL